MTQKTTQNGWTEKSLKELVDIFDSKRIPLSTGERAKRKGQFPYYGASNIVDYIDDFIFDGDYLLISEDGENLNTRNTPIAFLASGKFWVNNHAHIVRGKEEHMTKYLYWYFSQLDISPYITGAVQPKLSKSNLESIRIKVPENPDEQRAIAAVLSSLDDKIELLREQNKTLEAMAQELFREWFTEFNFPDADGKPYKKNGGKMIDSELGEIPKGWSVGRLGEEFEIIMGQSPSGESYNEDRNGAVFFQGRAEFQDRFPKTRLYTTEPKRMAEKFDVLVSVRAPVGDINVAFERCCIGRGLAAVKGKNKSYMLYKIKSLKEVFDKFEAEGTVFGSINKDSFEKIVTMLPSEELIKMFEGLARLVDQKYFNNYMQIQTLSASRDELLPRLMNGHLTSILRI